MSKQPPRPWLGPGNPAFWLRDTEPDPADAAKPAYVLEAEGMCPYPGCGARVWDGDRQYCELHTDFRDDPPDGEEA
jgi:hypothetical protein